MKAEMVSRSRGRLSGRQSCKKPDNLKIASVPHRRGARWITSLLRIVQRVQAMTPISSHLMWRDAKGEVWSSVYRSEKLVWHQFPPTTSRKQLHTNCADTQEKKMWFESSGVAQSGQRPEPGTLRLRTSTPDGSRPRIHRHMKIRIFRGKRMDHTVARGEGRRRGRWHGRET